MRVGATTAPARTVARLADGAAHAKQHEANDHQQRQRAGDGPDQGQHERVAGGEGAGAVSPGDDRQRCESASKVGLARHGVERCSRKVVPEGGKDGR